MQVLIENGHVSETVMPTRFQEGETAIIIARAEEIWKGCRFELRSSTERQGCCYTSKLGHNLDHRDDLCVSAALEEEQELTCRDNSSYLVEEVCSSKL